MFDLFDPLCLDPKDRSKNIKYMYIFNKINPKLPKI